MLGKEQEKNSYKEESKEKKYNNTKEYKPPSKHLRRKILNRKKHTFFFRLFILHQNTPAGLQNKVISLPTPSPFFRKRMEGGGENNLACYGSWVREHCAKKAFALES